MKASVHRIRRVFSSLAGLLFIAAMPGYSPAQEARVAASALKFEPVSRTSEIRVSLRFLDAVSVTGAEAKSSTQTTPVSWTAFDSLPNSNCAWMIVIDNSNPARQRTVEACAEETRSFLKLLPKGDAVLLASLARDLVVSAPFDAPPAALESALAGMKAEGDASFTSLIFQNVKHALADHLATRTETRRCVVLFTDGKDETPGGPLRVTERRNELITAAKKLGAAVHTLGFAEKATEANYFGDLKELSIQTDGLHMPAAVATRQLPPDTWPTLIGAMHSGGSAVLNLEGVKESGALRLELTCATGRKAAVEIPQEVVKAVVQSAPVVALRTEPVMAVLPALIGWTTGGVILLLLLIVMAARWKKVAAARAKKSTAIQPEPPAKVTRGAETPGDEAPMLPLVFLEMMDAGSKRYPVSAKGVKIGSARHNDIVVKHDSVSEDHCFLSLKNGEWLIADTNSVNGLRVNATYYHQTTLSPGDVIQLGEVRMRFLTE